MTRTESISAFLAQLAIATLCFATPSLAQSDKITYDDHVKPIFSRRCATCHNGQKKSADLDLTNYTNMMQGGSSGDSIEPGDADGSFLYMLVTHEESPEMPPGGTKIPAAEISLIEKWIDLGALENKGSKARIRKPIAGASPAGSIASRPEVVVVPPRLPVESIGETPLRSAAVSIAASPWTPLIAVSAQRQILLYESTTKTLRGILPFPEGQASILRFSASGQFLLAGGGTHGGGGKVVIWDVATGERFAEIGDEIDNVLAADISPDHRFVALGGPQKMLRVYSVADGTLVYETNKHTDWLTSIAFSTDGVLLASGDRNGGLHIWESESGNEYLTLKGHTKIINGLSWRSDANALASASGDGTIKLWEAENGQQIKSWKAHEGGTTSVDFTRDNRVASTGRDRHPKLWQQDGKQIRQFDAMPDIGLSVAYCNESKRIFCGDLSGSVKIWQAADGKLLGNIETNLPTLAQRMAKSDAALGEAKSKLFPLQEQLGKLNVRRSEILSRISSIKETLKSLAADVVLQQSEYESTLARIQQHASQRKDWESERDTKNSALPTLTELHEKAKEALALLPGDPDLKSTVEKLANKSQALELRIRKLETLIQKSELSTSDETSRADALTSSIANIQQQQEASSVLFSAATAELEPTEKPFSKLTAEISRLQKAVADATSRISDCQSEIEFIRQLDALKTELENAETLVQDRDDELHAAASKLDEAQKNVDKKLSDKNSAIDAAAKIEAKIRDLKKRE